MFFSWLITFTALTVKCVKSVPAYFAERLYESMKVNILLKWSETGGTDLLRLKTFQRVFVPLNYDHPADTKQEHKWMQ